MHAQRTIKRAEGKMTMWKPLLLATIAMLLPSCAAQFERAAEAACTPAAGDKNAYQDCVNSEYARRVERAQRIARGIAAATEPYSARATPLQPTTSAPQRRSIRFLRSSYVSGMNRICVYDNMGSEEHVTIGAAEMCPIQ
jgi:hypothetical protein